MSKKIFVSLFALTLLVSPIFAKKAEAQWFTFDAVVGAFTGISAINDTLITAKEYVLDMVVNLLVKATIKRVVASTVTWINSGFQGNPAFISDPEKFFTNIGDGVAGQLIYNNPNFKFMCAPFKAKVQVAINRAYNQPLGNFSCTLSSVISNYDNFIGDFSQGGWDGFIEVTQKPQNNPLGLYSMWNNQVIGEVGEAQDQKERELAQNNGFLSFKTCSGGYFTAETAAEANADIGKDIYEAGDCAVGQEKTNTPGSVIKTQLDGVLGLDNQSLVSADEINELVGALLGQLTGKLLNKGLAGLSQIGSGDDTSKSYTEDLITGKDGADELQKQSEDTEDSDIYPCVISSTDASGLPIAIQGESPNPSGSPCNPKGSSNSNFTPITATDGSVITGAPSDPYCSQVSFDDIVKGASTKYYANEAVNKAAGNTIAKFVQTTDCSPKLCFLSLSGANLTLGEMSMGTNVCTEGNFPLKFSDGSTAYFHPKDTRCVGATVNTLVSAATTIKAVTIANFTTARDTVKSACASDCNQFDNLQIDGYDKEIQKSKDKELSVYYRDLTCSSGNPVIPARI